MGGKVDKEKLHACTTLLFRADPKATWFIWGRVLDRYFGGVTQRETNGLLGLPLLDERAPGLAVGSEDEAEVPGSFEMVDSDGRGSEEGEEEEEEEKESREPRTYALGG
jgi:hypothetical protein